MGERAAVVTPAQLESLLGMVAAIRARADVAAHNAKIAKQDLASLQRQIEEIIILSEAMDEVMDG